MLRWKFFWSLYNFGQQVIKTAAHEIVSCAAVFYESVCSCSRIPGRELFREAVLQPVPSAKVLFIGSAFSRFEKYGAI